MYEIELEKDYFTYRDIKHIIKSPATLRKLRDAGLIYKVGVIYNENYTRLTKYRVVDDDGYFSNRRSRVSR